MSMTRNPKDEFKLLPKIIIKNKSTRTSPSAEYKRISVEDANADEKNPKDKNFWSVTQPIYSIQAARILQRAYRRKHAKIFTGTYSETLKAPLSLQFFQEPIDDKYVEHAKHIRTGNWLELDFHEPEFTRNIFKALRNGLIDSYQLATADMWQAFILFLQNREKETHARLHSFEEKGPYNPANISYATPKNIKKFKLALKKIPVGERNYLAIDLPSEHEIVFLYCGMNRRLFNRTEYSPFFREVLKKYLLKSNQLFKKDLIKLVDKHDEKSLNELSKFIKRQFDMIHPSIDVTFKSNSEATAHFENEKGKKLFSHYLLFANLLAVNEQNPALSISLDYNADDPKSPLLCMILPAASAMITLQQAMHGKDTTLPKFTAGKLTTYDLLDVVKHSKNHYRAVELCHPDLANPEYIHGAFFTETMLTWHDAALHVWRNGANMHKDFILHLINSFQEYTKFKMSKSIWRLVDMDFSIGKFIREEEKERLLYHYIKVDMFSGMLNRIVDSFWSQSKSHQALLLIIDMIVHREKWKEALGQCPENFFPKRTFTNNIWVEDTSEVIFTNKKILFPHHFTEFQAALAEMTHVIKSYPQKDLYCTAICCILAFRLKGHKPGLQQLDKLQSVGLDKIFCWERNGGITVLDKNFKSDQVLADLSGDALCTQLKKIALFTFAKDVSMPQTLDRKRNFQFFNEKKKAEEPQKKKRATSSL